MLRAGFVHKVASSLLLIMLACLPALLMAQDGASVEAGEKLYKQHCTACHKINRQLVGPALKGVNEKYSGDEEWLYGWIRNAPALIKQGDEKAVALYNQYNQQQMTAFPFLSDGDIDNILVYIEEASKPQEEVAPTQVAATGGSVVDDPTIYYALLGLVGVLVLIALLLVVITATLVTAVRSKEEKEPFSFGDVMGRTRLLLQNKFVLTAITAFVLVGGSAKWIAEARTIGLHQGYMPEQPVKFSHKLHAGTHQIDCQYCHSGVTKSKSAWIPSVNICMNCHKYIQEGPQYGTEEIGKVLAAWEGSDAIEWVRIHNLPDHAYFNHAQHVVVGGLECQTCHGPVEEMEVVYQYSDLGMGWCINCHRETKVKVLGEETDMTVEDMGGLNCARCHY
jgi:cytochrome c551/c552